MERSLQNVLKSGLLALVMLFSPALTAAGDTAETAQPDLSVLRQSGEVNGYLTLPVGDTTIDATLIPDRSGRAYGKVLILHDNNDGIDSPGLINTLRLGLPDAGWTTMTVAMSYPHKASVYLAPTAASAAQPKVAASDATASLPEENTEQEAEANDDIQLPPDNAARVSAALAYLNARQSGTTVILAVGEAAKLADALAGQLGEKGGLIWIRPDIELSDIPAIMPILDIASTLPGRINKQARARRVFMQQQQVEEYAQRRISGAGYRFYGFEQRVLNYVRGWLAKQFVEVER